MLEIEVYARFWTHKVSYYSSVGAHGHVSEILCTTTQLAMKRNENWLDPITEILAEKTPCHIVPAERPEPSKLTDPQFS